MTLVIVMAASWVLATAMVHAAQGRGGMGARCVLLAISALAGAGVGLAVWRWAPLDAQCRQLVGLALGALGFTAAAEAQRRAGA